MKFGDKIPSGCSENSEQLYGIHFYAGPCIPLCLSISSLSAKFVLHEIHRFSERQQNRIDKFCIRLKIILLISM